MMPSWAGGEQSADPGAHADCEGDTVERTGRDPRPSSESDEDPTSEGSATASSDMAVDGRRSAADLEREVARLQAEVDALRASTPASGPSRHRVRRVAT